MKKGDRVQLSGDGQEWRGGVIVVMSDNARSLGVDMDLGEPMTLRPNGGLLVLRTVLLLKRGAAYFELVSGMQMFLRTDETI